MTWSRLCWLWVALTLAACTSETNDTEPTPVRGVAQAARVPSGFVDELVTAGFTSPTGFAFAPDGRIFVAQQDGRVAVVKNGALLPTPFATLPVAADGEGGLLGVAVDPDFANNPFVYVFYTLATPARHNRVSRLRAAGDVAVAGSETVLIELDDVGNCNLHFGGALRFSPERKLYVGVGDSCEPSSAQSLTRTAGKLLRIDPDGTIPTDNPFYGTASGRYRAIWAYGFRNPYTFAVSRTGRVFINDVGGGDWEEVNEGAPGANYGWPLSEGATSIPGQTSPVYAYPHSNPWPTGCAITGGAFYDPITPQYPAAYVGKYFYADYCKSYIRQLDTTTYVSTEFSDEVAQVVDIALGPDAMLYRLERGSSSIMRIRYAATGQAPVIAAAPTSRTVAAGQSTTFTVSASGSQPLSYQWQRNGSNIAGATAASYTLTASAGDSGATFRVVVSNTLGSVTSTAATLTVVASSAPVATITTPAANSSYSGGQTISFAGTATDAEDGALPASAFTWEVVFHHDEHTHPFVAPFSGQSSGTFVVPRIGHTETSVWYRIRLRVQDSTGLVSETYRDIVPVLSTLQLSTNPPGLRVTLDGTPLTTPTSVTSVAGVTRTLGVVSPQFVAGTRYTFSGWSDGGATTHTIDTPAVATSYVATFAASPGCEGPLQVVSASASSVEAAQPQLVAANAVDGDPNTRWASAFSDPQWLLLDLGASRTITGVVLSWEAAFGRDYQLQVSDSASGPFSTVFTRTGFTGGTDTISNVTGVGRYLRVYIAARATHWGNSLYEVQVLGSANGTCGAVCGNGTVEAGEACDDGNTSPRDGCSATCTVESSGCASAALPRVAALASSVENSELPASHAIDGNLTTRWSSAFSEPQWIQVDLGAARHVSGVVLRWETAHARNYRIELADTPTGPYRTLFTRNEFGGGVDTVSGVSGQGRYLRVYITQRATSWGNSLYELEVLGDEDPGC